MDIALASKKNPDISKNVALTLFLTGIFMGALDHGIVGPAFSSINRFFGIATLWGVWSFTIYTLMKCRNDRVIESTIREMKGV